MKYQTGGIAIILLALSGCTSVRVDTQPQASLGASRFYVEPASCTQVINSRSVLPLDIYHMGVCHEQGVGVPVSTGKALEYYQEAARWGVPEARTALERLGQTVPGADMEKKQEHRGEQIEDDRTGSRKIKVIHSQ